MLAGARWGIAIVGTVTTIGLVTFSVSANADRASLQDYMALTGPDPTAVFRYGPAPSQYAELTLPTHLVDTARLVPVVILIHGGCWNSRFGGLRQFRALAGAFAALGIAAWNIEYRRVDESGGGFPGTYLDIGEAIDTLVKAAADPHLESHLDLHRVAAVGHSAGGQLALWVAGRDRIPANSPLHASNADIKLSNVGTSGASRVLRIGTVISLGGLPDLRDDADAIKDACGLDPTALTGEPSAARPDVFVDTSPAAMLPLGIPTVEINGEDDTVAPPALARGYANLARRVGDSVRTIVIPDAGHFDEVMTRPPVWPTLRTTVLNALGMTSP